MGVKDMDKDMEDMEEDEEEEEGATTTRRRRKVGFTRRTMWMSLVCCFFSIRNKLL